MRQKKIQNTLNCRDEGVIVIEAIYIVVITIFVIMFVFDFGVLFHNRMVTAAAADEAAAAAGATYNSAARDPFTGYVPPEFFTNRKIFRYRDDNLQNQARRKAQWYGSYLIYSDELSTEHKTDFASTVKAECSYDMNLGCQVVSVNMEREYKTFFINPLQIFGIEPTYTCKATGTAVCYDPIYQLNLMQMVDQMSSDAEGMSKIGKAAGEIKSLLENICDLF